MRFSPAAKARYQAIMAKINTDIAHACDASREALGIAWGGDPYARQYAEQAALREAIDEVKCEEDEARICAAEAGRSSLPAVRVLAEVRQLLDKALERAMEVGH